MYMHAAAAVMRCFDDFKTWTRRLTARLAYQLQALSYSTRTVDHNYPVHVTQDFDISRDPGSIITSPLNIAAHNI